MDMINNDNGVNFVCKDIIHSYYRFKDLNNLEYELEYIIKFHPVIDAWVTFKDNNECKYKSLYINHGDKYISEFILETVETYRCLYVFRHLYELTEDIQVELSLLDSDTINNNTLEYFKNKATQIF